MFTITENGKSVRIYNTYRDSKGVVQTPKDVPIWSTDSPEAVGLDPSEDGLSCGLVYLSESKKVTVSSELVSAKLTNSNVFETVAAEAVISSVESEVIVS